jgi:PncC family amidohydrolase
METVLIKRCIEKKLTLAVAESCTGGGLGALLTSVPGASTVFKGGVICYADEIKRRLLNVPEEVLESEGAVSQACAEAMARGARTLCGTDLAVAITGIAGPSGATDEKPVGLVYLCAVTEDAVLSSGKKFEGDRAAIRKQAMDEALALLLKII